MPKFASNDVLDGSLNIVRAATRMVAVAGPGTPNITDSTVPQVDLATLADVGDALSVCSSPFAKLAISNPPYLRLTVTATVEFIDSDTGAFWSDRLERDLIAWLSPVPTPEIEPRPANYYTRRAVAEFIRHRPYVRAISSILIKPDSHHVPGQHYYLTSAANHNIIAAPARRPDREAIAAALATAQS